MIQSEEGNWLPIGPDTSTTDPVLVNEIYEFCESYTPGSPQSKIIIVTEILPRQQTIPQAGWANLPQPIADE